ncbi:helix-turn-helix domain-containing protein [Bifidobacterium scaligerum]|uniref:Excisionase n=1 Tax=Bifidobacterium scaligerum TaxID=2052656 RepID=A0A2M9HP38_9BIFI|nr:helix-turn-helix domain-containing protein [Bifidobacterium scaligerum]PJM78570.1 excisionase [Bifidobacterium scaligerum]
MVIRTNRTLLTQGEAARQLGVSERRVSALRASGQLESFPVGSGVLLTEDSVRRQARWQGAGGRPYSPSMAFAALYMLSGFVTPWLSRQQRYRLRGYLRGVNAENLVRLTRRSAATVEYWCRDSNLNKVEEIIRPSAATGELADSFQLTVTDTVEGYVNADNLIDVVRQCRLKQGAIPIRVRLHITDGLPAGEGSMPLAVCAADLAESDDPRERRAGLETLQRLIDDYNLKEHQE